MSGSLGLDPKTGELKEGIKEQAHQSLKNIGEILKAAGVGYGNGGSILHSHTVVMRSLAYT